MGSVEARSAWIIQRVETMKCYSFRCTKPARYRPDWSIALGIGYPLYCKDHKHLADEVGVKVTLEDNREDETVG